MMLDMPAMLDDCSGAFEPDFTRLPEATLSNNGIKRAIMIAEITTTTSNSTKVNR